AVDAERDLGVPVRAKHRAGAGVGVQEPDLLGRELEAHAVILQVVRIVGEEGEVGRLYPALAPREREQAELETTIHRWEQRLTVLEVVQADERALLDQVAEERRGGCVGGDA